MAVEAIVMGGNSQKGYAVNVRNANPKGMLGDAGIIRFFETKEEAKTYANLVNTTGVDVFLKKDPIKDEPLQLHKGDEFVKTAKDIPDDNELLGETAPLEISWARTVFGRLTDEQIKAVNEGGKLPENVRFVRTIDGTYYLSPAYGGLVTGTRTLPEGFELKKNVLGFTVVVPKDTEGIFIKDAAA